MDVTPGRANSCSLGLSASRCRSVLATIVLSACRAEPEAQISTHVEALLPASRPAAQGSPSDAACEFVEREARKLNASMPRQLDTDTAATRVTARGCALTLEYQLLNLVSAEVAPAGMQAMRARVADQLCTDLAARATLERGGTFTNVYSDQSHARIGQFTVSADDCAPPLARPREESRL